ncbi:MAG: mechanosensitive ion channel, partial [Clostridia bacterium]|nr:mechanosensitive ion channel [Clostridia bacterium]
MEEFLNKVIELGTTYGGKVILAIVAALVGLLIIKLVCKALKKIFAKSKLDGPVQVIIIKIIKVLLYIILLVAIIEILGIPMTSVAALIASAGLAVGLAFQGALANLAGGLMILIFRPFKLGDYVSASGADGFVRDISIFYTKLTTIDNKVVLVPNGDLMNSNVTNFTAEEKRRVDI